jgi:hypothetical protein
MINSPLGGLCAIVQGLKDEVNFASSDLQEAEGRGSLARMCDLDFFSQLVGRFSHLCQLCVSEAEFDRSLVQISIVTSPAMNICSEDGELRIDIATSALTRQMGDDAMLIYCEKMVSKD